MNAQAGSITGLAGKGDATLQNITTSTVAASGDATARTGDVPGGATLGSAPATAFGATTSNTVIDRSVISVSIGGANEAPVTVTNENTRNVKDAASASATSGAAGTGAPAVTETAASPVTTGNAASPVSASAVTAAAAQPASCAGHEAESAITGTAEKTVSAPAASGQPIEIAIAQRASTTNTGSTTGALSAVVSLAASGPAPAANTATGDGTTGGAANGSTAKGLSATNTVENTALVDVTIGGSNYAPINIAVRTVTTIFNAARAVVETATGGGEAGGDASGVGARAANNISLDGTAAVEIAGDNHNPIRIVLDIGAEIWNKGMALLGIGQGPSGAAAGATATGLEVENLMKLLGRASVRIGGSNYAPIDIEVLLQNLIHNEGIAGARSAGSDAAARASDVIRDVSSGPAACASLLSTAGVVNGQVASVKLADDAMRRRVLAGNAHVVDVQGYGAARCLTGDVVGSDGNVSSGSVTVAGGGTTLAVVTTQVADTSAKTEPAADAVTPGGGTGGTAPGGGGGTGGTAQVVVAVTTTPVKVAGNTAGGRGKNQSSLAQDEEVWEWVVVWEPLYVIYPSAVERIAPRLPIEIPADETETTTSMAGSFHRPAEVVTPFVYDVGGMDLFSQLLAALLSLVAFLLLTLIKRRLKVAAARKLALRRPQLNVVTDVADAAD